MVATAHNTVRYRAYRDRGRVDELKLTCRCRVFPPQTPRSLACLQSFHVECTSLYICREFRRQVARKVRVDDNTPRTLWCHPSCTTASRGIIGSGGGSGGGGRDINIPSANPSIAIGNVQGSNSVLARMSQLTVGTSITTDIKIDSRVPLVRVTHIMWMLSKAKLMSGGFRWRDGVKKLEFGTCYRSSSAACSTELLSLGETTLDRPLKPGYVPLPPGLKTIRFKQPWDINLLGARECWPESLETFFFAQKFNEPLSGDAVGLPRGLREIDLGQAFNQPLIGVEWPPLLRKLTFSHMFNQSLEGVRFPDGLREINLGWCYNREISRVTWPKGLETLRFGRRFDQALVSPGEEGEAPFSRKHALPAGLKNLKLGSVFNQPIGRHALPTGLKTLSLSGTLKQTLSGSELPAGLEVLKIASIDTFLPVRWPSGLKKLTVRCTFGRDQRLVGGGLARSTLPTDLPPNLEVLNVEGYFNSPLTTVNWPPTLKVLNVGRFFNHPIGGTDTALLPDGLEQLELRCDFKCNFENVRLPVGLKRLTVWGTFNQGLAGVSWPPGLEALWLRYSFNQPLEGAAFPETLRELVFGKAFTCSLRGVALPNGLKRLAFPSNYPVSHLRALEWPRSLRDLHVGSSWFGCRESLATWAAQHP